MTKFVSLEMIFHLHLFQKGGLIFFNSVAHVITPAHCSKICIPDNTLCLWPDWLGETVLNITYHLIVFWAKKKCFFFPLVINGIWQLILFSFTEEYVTCHTCRSPETILQKDTRLYFLQCETCHSRCSVASIKTGFQAVTGKRAQLRAKAN